MVWWMATGSPLFNPQPKTLEQLLPQGSTPTSCASATDIRGDFTRQQQAPDYPPGDSQHPAAGREDYSRSMIASNPREAIRKGLVKGALAYDVNEMHLAAMIAILGRFPQEVGCSSD
jgi:hypothetical protein